MSADGSLFLGDNLDILREHVADASVDLVYLDPPFNTNRAYASAPRRAGGPKILRFDDTWRWDARAEAAFEAARSQRGAPTKLVGLLDALRELIGEGDLLAYLVMMAARLV